MWKVLALLATLAGVVVNGEVYSADLKDAVTAELAMIRGVYRDKLDEIKIGDFSTEDFTLKNIRIRGMNRVQVMGPCTIYANTDYLTAFNQALIGVENAEFLVEQFQAPYLFYEGNETLNDVKFVVKKFGINIREGIHFSLPEACDMNYGLEIMALDNSTLYSSVPKFNNQDVTPFVHYTVRLALNEFLAKTVNKNNIHLKNCVPFSHSTKFLSFFHQLVQ